jgi:hypothetical protein
MPAAQGEKAGKAKQRADAVENSMHFVSPENAFRFQVITLLFVTGGLILPIQKFDGWLSTRGWMA